MEAAATGEEKEDTSPKIPEDMLNVINSACAEGSTSKMSAILNSGGEVDLLFIITIALCKTGMDRHSEMTKIFIEKTLTRIFKWIHDDYDLIKKENRLPDEAVVERIKQLLQLIVIKLPDDSLPLLNLLAITFDPLSRFYTHHENDVAPGPSNQDSTIFAESEDIGKPLGILVDIINYFGQLGGFKLVLEKFKKSMPSIPLAAALLRPFGQCYELLTRKTVEKYFIMVLDRTRELLNSLTDEELTEFCDSPDLAIGETNPDAINIILLALEGLSTRVPPGNEIYSNMELFRMRMTLRLKHARGLPYGRDLVCGHTSMNVCEESSEALDCDTDVTEIVSEKSRDMEQVDVRLVGLESARGGVGSSGTPEVSVRYPGYTETVRVSSPPRLSRDFSRDLNDDEHVSITYDDSEHSSVEGAAQAMPKEHGDTFSSHFDISPIQETSTRGTRWSANSSDISGTTSKSLSVRDSAQDLCRFCYELDQSAGNRMIKPCNCSGSAAYVHSKCLKKWIHFSRNTQCEVCHTNFTYIPYSERVRAFLEEFRRNKRWRNATFATLVGLVVLLYLVIFAVFPGGIIDV